MKKTDQVYLEDVLDMIQKIETFTEDVSYDEFENNTQLQFAVFHAFEVIGEASNKLSQHFVEKYPEFPAREAVEMRNILIHGYDIIRLDIVWKTIADHLPLLKEQVVVLLQ